MRKLQDHKINEPFAIFGKNKSNKNRRYNCLRATYKLSSSQASLILNKNSQLNLIDSKQICFPKSDRSHRIIRFQNNCKLKTELQISNQNLICQASRKNKHQQKSFFDKSKQINKKQNKQFMTLGPLASQNNKISQNMQNQKNKKLKRRRCLIERTNNLQSARSHVINVNSQKQRQYKGSRRFLTQPSCQILNKIIRKRSIDLSIQNNNQKELQISQIFPKNKNSIQPSIIENIHNIQIMLSQVDPSFFYKQNQFHSQKQIPNQCFESQKQNNKIIRNVKQSINLKLSKRIQNRQIRNKNICVRSIQRMRHIFPQGFFQKNSIQLRKPNEIK